LIYKVNTLPLKEGKVVSLPDLGIFRSIKSEGENFKISFAPSMSLRNRLNSEKKDEKTEVVYTNEDNETIKKEQNLEPVFGADNVKKGVSSVEIPEIEDVGSEEDEEIPYVELKEKGLEKETLQATVTVDKEKIIPREVTSNQSANLVKTAQVGDVIVPQDEDRAKSKRRKRRRNLSGWLLVIVSFFAVIIIISTSIFPLNKVQRSEPIIIDQSDILINLPELAEEKYGNRIFWVYIFDANKDKLTSPVNIPKGTTITLPDLVEEYAVDVKDSLEMRRANSMAERILKDIQF
jgi:hypothetical protein